jgi:PAS domain S-box-containing protein
LAESESRYRGLVDHAPFGIFTTKGFDVTFSNRYNQVLAGLDPDEDVDPATFHKFIHPEDRDRILSESAQAVASSQPYETVFRFLHANGTTRKVLSRRLPIRIQRVPLLPTMLVSISTSRSWMNCEASSAGPSGWRTWDGSPPALRMKSETR